MTDEDRDDIRKIVSDEIQRAAPNIATMVTANTITLLQQMGREMAQAQTPIVVHMTGLRDDVCALVSALDKLATSHDDDAWRHGPQDEPE